MGQHHPCFRWAGPWLAVASITAAPLFGCAGDVGSPLDALGRTRPLIIGGEAASASDYPSTVAITTVHGDPFCSGTLIGPNLVVTAAHCVDRRALDDIRVVYGYEVPSESSVDDRLIPSLIQVHPAYDPLASTDAYGLGELNDIAAIVLENPIPGGIVAPILPLGAVDTELTPNRPVHIAGYGEFSNLTHQSGVLFRGITPHIRHSATELLAGRLGEADTCFGDSGGPAYIVTNDTLWLVGATSRAWAWAVQPCGESTIYTTVSAYADWLGSLPGAEVDGGQVDGGFEGGGWAHLPDASGGSLIDADPACVPPTAVCNPLTNEGCDAAAGQACHVDQAKSGVYCLDGPNLTEPGERCDQVSRLCKPGYYCGSSTKCEKLCCSDADCPPGVTCESLITLLGNLGTCGVLPADGEPHDAADDAKAAIDAGADAAGGWADPPGDPGDASSAWRSAAAAENALMPGCACRAARPSRGPWAGLVLMGVALVARRRRVRSTKRSP